MVLLLLAACKGDEEVLPSGPVAQVRISPDARLLTRSGETAQLKAQAYDAAGKAVSASITWRSTRGDAIAVDATGLITAKVENGSAQIIAEASGVSSPPLLAVVTQLPAGAVLLRDDQIVGDPVAVDPAARPSIGNTYRVVLTGVSAPAAGALLVNTESKPVAGRVVSTSPEGERTTVTLRLVPMRELFPRLRLQETIALAGAEVVPNPALAATYETQRTGNKLTFTPKAPAAKASAGDGVRRASANGQFSLGPFTCETAVTGLNRLPLRLSSPPVLSVTQNLGLDLVYTPEHGVERLVLRGEVGAAYDGSLTVSVAFEGAISCEFEVHAVRIPIGGPLSLFVGGLIPLKLGFEVGGRLTVASASVGLKADASATAELGVACPNGAACQFVRSLTGHAEAKPVFQAPSFGADLRFEPSFSVFGKAELAIGNPILRTIRFTAVEAQMGPKLEGSFAPWRSQIEATDYRSAYALSFESRVGVGSDLGGALELLGLERIDAVELKGSVPLGSSPVGTVSASTSGFEAGDPVDFTVRLEPSKVDFLPLLGPYNVREVVLVRRVAGLGAPREVARARAASGQTEFRLSFRATDSGRVEEFFAFVVTTLLPLDLFGLELGQATPPSPYRVDVQMPSEIPATTSAQVVVTVTRPNGQGGFEPASGLHVELSATCGSVSPTSGTTSVQGTVTATVTANTGCTEVSLRVVLRESPTSSPVADRTFSATVPPPPKKTPQELVVGSYTIKVFCGVQYGTGTATATASGQAVSVTWNVTLSYPGRGGGGGCADLFNQNKMPTSGSFSGIPVWNAARGRVEIALSSWQVTPCGYSGPAPTMAEWYSNSLILPLYGSCVSGAFYGVLLYDVRKVVP
ncbi:MAG: hypothetical protein IT371_12900 [Deltaproteobacteria bacterium]|nr:hypothetical protein [Deltaproteobacteria bacterium]